MEGRCTRFREYVSEECIGVGEGIERSRKELTTSLGRDVTKEEAQSHYAEIHLDMDAVSFRKRFCPSCPDRKRCGVTGKE